jgi:hypothetical protein
MCVRRSTNHLVPIANEAAGLMIDALQWAITNGAECDSPAIFARSIGRVAERHNLKRREIKALIRIVNHGLDVVTDSLDDPERFDALVALGQQMTRETAQPSSPSP